MLRAWEGPERILSVKKSLESLNLLLLCFKKLKDLLSTINALGHSWAAELRNGFTLLQSVSAGGMLIAWKSELFKLEAFECGAFSLSARLLDRKLGTSWCISCIYGPASNIGKEEYWIELNDLGNLTEGNWCIGGDFNEVLYSEDRKGRSSSNSQRRNFHEWLSDFGLIEVPTNNI